MLALGPLPRHAEGQASSIALPASSAASYGSTAPALGHPETNKRRRPASAKHECAAFVSTTTADNSACAEQLTDSSSSALAGTAVSEGWLPVRSSRPASAHQPAQHRQQHPSVQTKQTIVNSAGSLQQPQNPATANVHKLQQQQQRRQQQQHKREPRPAIRPVCYEPPGLPLQQSSRVPKAVQELLEREQHQQQEQQRDGIGQWQPIDTDPDAYAPPTGGSSSSQLDPIQEENSEEHYVGPRCRSANLAGDASFTSASFAGSGRTSPTAMQANQRRCQSSLSNGRQPSSSSQKRQQQRRSVPGYACGTQPPDCQVLLPARPWSNAGTQAARRLFGRQAVQLELQRQQAAAGATANQHKKPLKQCHTYSMDSKMCPHDNGRFSPSDLEQITRGAGFHMLPGCLPRCSGILQQQCQQPPEAQLQHFDSSQYASCFAASSRPGSATRPGGVRPGSAVRNIVQRPQLQDCCQQSISEQIVELDPDSTAAAAANGLHDFEQGKQDCNISCPASSSSSLLLQCSGGADWPAGSANGQYQPSRPVSAAPVLRYSAGVTRPLPAAVVAAAKLKDKQQECLSAAKAVAKLVKPLRSDYSATTKLQGTSNFGSQAHTTYSRNRRVYSSKPAQS